MIRIYTQLEQGQRWLQRYQGCPPILACILGFTATALIPGISAAGATPEDRKYTALADAEFLVNGVVSQPGYPLPPLEVGVSPVFISRAVVEAFDIPVYLFNAGLPQPPAVPAIDLGGMPAQCLTTGKALPLATVKHLFEQGLTWGNKLAITAAQRYLILSECVVGGTTTALSVLTGLGFDAVGKVNSSHPRCNHTQKWDVVQAGLSRWREWESGEEQGDVDPLRVVAAVGDPMQIVVAGMAIAASRHCGVLLAGGTQMLAVYALAQALVQHWQSNAVVSAAKPNPTITDQDSLIWQPEQVVVGTTRWVADDFTGDTVGLARDIGNVSLLATPLSFAESRYSQLQVYEQGYVKEGVGAGGCAIAASIYKCWNSVQLLQDVERLVEQYCLALGKLRQH